METLKTFVRPWGVAILLVMNTSFPVAAQQASAPAPELVELPSPQGQQRLKESNHNGDFFRLACYFTPQKNMAYCGVASSIMVLNALPVPKPQGDPYGTYPFYTQENFFSLAATAVKSPDRVAQEGMSLAELTDLLNTHPGVKAEKQYAANTSLEAFRKLTVDQLNSGTSYVLVNYLRKALGQRSGGHISPLGAYHAPSDSFLILDVSQYKYPPVWAPAQDLWRAMAQKDDEKSLSRGFVLVGLQTAVKTPP